MKTKVSAFKVFQSKQKEKAVLRTTKAREKTPIKVKKRQLTSHQNKKKFEHALKSKPSQFKKTSSTPEKSPKKSRHNLASTSMSSPEIKSKKARKTRADTSRDNGHFDKNSPVASRSLKKSQQSQYISKRKSVVGQSKSGLQPKTGIEPMRVNIADETLQSQQSENSAKESAVETHVVPQVFDSELEAHKVFTWLINPITISKFQTAIWEKKPMLVKRHNPNYFKGIFSTEMLDNILREKPVMFGKNLDVTSYINGKRETHNPSGRAFASVVWDFYQNGCSVRLLNPQIFAKSVWKLNATLQEYFGSYVGANIYLTPPESQGFAPHYDDIEAFVLQLEGKKKWKLYSPRSLEETLPRVSSENLDQSDVGEEILNVELEPGDMLYFPRGTIHQAVTGEQHSLHITISASQNNTWGDLLNKLVPRALELAIREDIDFRESVPNEYKNFMGVANCDIESGMRVEFMEKVGSLMKKLFDYAPVDACVDQFAKGYIHDCLPPFIPKSEKSMLIGGCPVRWKNGEIVNCTELEPDTELKLVRANILRLVTEDDSVRIYHSALNSLEYHKEPPQYFEIAAEVAPAVEHLLHAYPNFTCIDQFPLKEQSDQMEIANLLYEKGLVIIKGPKD